MVNRGKEVPSSIMRKFVYKSGRTQSAQVRKRRQYGSDETAEYDIDYKHQDDGTHVFLHVHTWTNGKRSKESIPYSEYFTPY